MAPSSETLLILALTAAFGPTLGPLVAQWLGPIIGPALLIIMGAVAGSALAMSKEDTMSLWEGVKFVSVGVGFALAVAGGAAWFAEAYLKVPVNVALPLISAFIGAARNEILEKLQKIPSLFRLPGGNQ